MEPVKHSRLSSKSENGPLGPLAESEMRVAAGLLSRAVLYGQQKPLTKLVEEVTKKSRGVVTGSQVFLAGLSSEVVGTMADSSKRQRDFEEESSWGILTEPSELGSPGSVVRASLAYNPPKDMTGNIPMPGMGTMMDAPVNILTPNGEDCQVPLPPGIPDVMVWSRTEIKLPKLAGRRWTYKDFVANAHNDPDLRKYAHFIMETYGYYASTSKTKNYTQGVDFGYFLCRVRFNPGDQQVPSFARTLRG